MRNEARGDVWKVWIYAAAAVVLGAWISPLLYNAGKALAEVSATKTTNGALEWLADRCRTMDFAAFFKAGLLLAAVALFFPWMEWIHARRGGRRQAGGHPWHIRLPEGATMAGPGQPLRENPRGMWHGCAGFLVVSGLLLPMSVALLPEGALTLGHPGETMFGSAFSVLAGAIIPAVVMEGVFRGMALGIFLRAMRPAVALTMSAVFFAGVLCVIPSNSFHVADPDVSGVGFEMLGRIAGGLADWRNMLEGFMPLAALGLVLAYARWRTASLWLPAGLHTGWLFAKGMLAKLSAADTGGLAPAGELIHRGIVPLTAIVIAGVMAHFLTVGHRDESAIRP